jgi:hypothetical protein
MEKKGRVSTVGFVLAVTSGGLGASSSAHLSIAPFRGDEFDGSRSGSAIQFGAVDACRVRKSIRWFEAPRS